MGLDIINACKHCKSIVNTKDIYIDIDNTKFFFCTDGCKKAFEILEKEGLSSFYNKIGNSKIYSVETKDIDYKQFDTLAFEEQFVKEDKDGLYESSFFIKGITCSACVWLNENILLKQSGIISANVNMTNKTAKIVWDNELIKVSQILELINSIGYEAYPYTPKVAHTQMQEEKKEYLSKLSVAIFATLNIMMVDISKYKGLFTFIEDDVKSVFHIAEFALASLVLFYSGSIFFKKAYGGIRNHIVNMEFLVGFGAILGYGYSLWVLFSKNGETYFDSVVMIITFVLVGKYLELISKQKSIEALEYMQDIPSMINIIDSDKSIIQKLPRMVKKGDLICIKPKEKIIIDGKIIKGKGDFDVSAINGESILVHKNIGSQIISGSISIDADITYEATNNFANSFLGQISSILQDTMSKKDFFADKISLISGYFGIVIIALSIATFFGWYIFTNDFSRAFIVGISVVIISCPCALALSIPIAIMISLDSLIRKNIICKDSNLLDVITKSKYCIFDKTNTLTEGKFSIFEYKIQDDFDINLIYSIVKTSTHPISMGVKDFIEKEFKNTKTYKLSSVQNIASKGLKASIVLEDKEHNILVGNLDFLKENNIKIPDINITSSIFAISCNNTFIGYFKLEDKLKNEAKESIEKIKKIGLLPIILSGDNQEATKKIAKMLDIPFKANYSLKQKKEYIKKLQEKNHKVIMIGDGINDSLALLQSDVSISFYNASSITIESSNILLGNKNLLNINFLFFIAQNSKSLIRQNLSISLLYNALTIPLAILGYITPLIAALSMSLSSLIVVFNAIRMKYKRPLKVDHFIK